MGVAPLLGPEEEAHVLRLARSQPESAGELTAFAERLRERVVDAALADGRVRERLARSRYRVIAADYREDKAPEGEPVPRLAEVGAYDYDRDGLVVAVVDLRAGAVLEVFEREGAAPPISPEELEEARELASRAPGVQEVLSAPGAQVVAFPTPSYAFEARRGAERHRGCALYLGGPDTREIGVVVDLSARELVPDEELPEILRTHGRRGGVEPGGTTGRQPERGE